MHIFPLKKKKFIRSNKKKSLLSFWFSIWLPLFCIALIAILIGTVFAHSYVCRQLAISFENKINAQSFERDWEHGTDYVVQNFQEIKKEGEDYAQSYIRFDMEYNMNLLWASQTYGVIMNFKKDVLATSGKCCYFRYSRLRTTELSTEWKHTWYQCKDPDILNELYKLQKKYVNKADESYIFAFDAVYVKDMEFLPEKLIVLKNNTPIDTFSFDLENKDISGFGYLKHLAVSETGKPFSLNYSAISIIGNNSRNWNQEYLENLTASAPLNTKNGFSFYKHSPDKFEGYYAKKINIRKEPYYLVLGTMYNPMEYLNPYILFALLGSFLFTAIFALALARKFYDIYQAEYLLQERQRNFSDALAHDLKTPLMAISGYTENLLAHTHPEKQVHYLTEIQSGIAYMNDLIWQILELSKWDRTIKLKKENVDLRQLIEKVIALHKEQADEKQLSVHVIGEESILASPEYLQRAITNLYTNAIRFSPEQQSVFIKLEPAYLEITNTGVELPTENPEELWKPFVKGDKSRSDKTGHGLGLSIVKEIMDLHDFSCEITSEANAVTVKLYFK